MSSTTLADLQSTETPWHATGYRTVNLANNEFRRTRFNFSTMGDGGVITTLPDLAKWVAHLMDPKVDRAFWLAMLNPIDRFFGPAPQFKFEQYVNGLIFTPLEVGSFYFHNGRSTSSMQSHMSFIPELKLGYLQMCNFDHVQQPALAALIKAYG
jgi:CubicO group peptidase (beta-lactamase class C family)